MPKMNGRKIKRGESVLGTTRLLRPTLERLVLGEPQDPRMRDYDHPAGDLPGKKTARRNGLRIRGGVGNPDHAGKAGIKVTTLGPKNAEKPEKKRYPREKKV